MTRAAAVIAALRASRGTCVCGDAFEPHRHYRRGWECSLCDDCRRYRRLPLRQRIADAITASRKPDPEAGGMPDDAEIKQWMTRFNEGGRR